MQRVGGAIQAEAFLGDDAVAQHGDETFRREEGRLHQDLGGVAGLVSLGAGDEQHFFLLHVPAGWALSAADPAGEFGLVEAAFFVFDGGGDADLPAQFKEEFTGGELGVGIVGVDGVGGFDVTSLHVFFHFLPLAVLVFPIQTGGAHADGIARERVAVNIGDDDFDGEWLAALDEVGVGAHTYVEAGRVHNPTAAGCPALAVDVVDGSLGVVAVGQRLLRRVEVDAQRVFARGVGARIEGSGLALTVTAAVEVVAPPGRPRAEGEVAPVRRPIGRGRRRHRPIGLRAGERTTGVVGRFDCGHSVIAHHERSFADGGCDLKLRSAEFLNLEVVAVLSIVAVGQDAVGHAQVHAGVAQVHIFGQIELQIEATQRVERGCALGHAVALRLVDFVAELAAPVRFEQRHIAGGAGGDAAQPALEVDGFAGFVHGAVVEDEVAGVGALRFLAPAVLWVAVVVTGIRIESDVVALLHEDQLRPVVAGQRQGDGAGLVGAASDVGGPQRHLGVAQGRAVGQAVGPHDHLVGVEEGVHADLGDLDKLLCGVAADAVGLITAKKRRK